VSTLAVKVGVAVGMVVAVASFFPLFKLLMGQCFFEQGCGKHENSQVFGVVLASCLVGVVAAWGVACLVKMMGRHEQ